MELEKILEEIENERTSYEAKHVKSYEKGLRFAADVIRKHMNDGWIPVEERLPEKERKSYLVTYVARNGRRYVKEAYLEYVGESPRVAYWTKKHRGCVIAWRPLPEPYRPERSEGE